MPSPVRRLAREPLVHFLLLGAALFALWRLTDDGAGPRSPIEVGEAEIESLIESWTSVWQRPPEVDELRRLVDGYVREEVLFREALELGLHRSDAMIRRRLSQKMELLGEGAEEIPTPTEAELETFVSEHREAFEREARLSFRHVYLDPGHRGDSVTADAAALLERLRAAPQGDITDLGDRLALPKQVGLMRAGEIRRLFGSRFVEAVSSLPVGRWSGPVESDMGLHLVRVDAREEARMPALEEILPEVESAWLAARQERARERRYEALRERYEIRVADLEAILERRAGDRSTP